LYKNLLTVNWKNIFFSTTVAGNCLLCFLLVFYDRLLIPSALQVAGRAHPLFLHFPVVLFVLFISWIWLVPKQPFHSVALFENIGKWLLLATAFTSVITALMGVFLSKEPGYNPDSLQWHKWSGALISLLTFIWYIFYQPLYRKKISLALTSLVSAVVLFIAGHQGAAITHGENYLFAPVLKEKVKKKAAFNEAVVYTDIVKPILEVKCMGCHNSNKAKGDLVMETRELLLRGGKNGPLWDTTDANLSLMLQRIHLPEDEKKHMPPAGKPQLTEQEITILYNWIKRGANFEVKATELEPTDTLRFIAENMFRSSDEQETYEFAAANENTIRKLNTNYRSVYPLSKESPAIAVDFYGVSFFKHEQLEELLQVKMQIVSLNLDKMPVTDPDLITISQFANLRTLNISFSKITGNGLSALKKLDHLKVLTLTNTTLTKDDIEKIAAFKSLHHLYIWNSGVALADVDQIRRKYPAVEIQTGMRTDTMFLKLNPPLVQNDAPIIDSSARLKLKHYVPHATIRYTLDGSEPDSIRSPLYDSQIFIHDQVLMKAKAFKTGWHASESVQYQFYKATYKPDTVILNKPADSSYLGKGGKTLTDLVKGELAFGDGKWLAFRKNNLECMMVFSSRIKTQRITISSLVNVGALIFPPKDIRILGGNDPNQLKLLFHMTPVRDTLRQSNYLIPYTCNFESTQVRFIKIIVEPVGKLPKQFILPKFDKGWFFIDEILVN
jgi:hypothetical protein